MLPAFLTLISPASSAAQLGYTAHQAHKSGQNSALGWVAVGVGLVLLVSIMQPTASSTSSPSCPPCPPPT
jgi:hypothetical protein